MTDKEAGQNKIKLWTAQHQIVIDTIRKNGVYKVKKEFIEQKYGQVADIFLEAYNWYVRRAEEIIDRPPEAEYPIWLTSDPAYLDHIGGGEKVLEIEVDRDRVIIFDDQKWNKILNLSYIPVDEADAQEHKQELDKYNLTSDSEAYLSPHYPQLKQKIKNSWDRLFKEDIRLSEVRRATLWQIKEEWIVDIE